MAKKRNRITMEMSKTISETSPLIKTSKKNLLNDSDLNTIIEINLEFLQKNPFQPRISIDLSNLNELISSIEENGLLQPIIVSKTNDTDYTIIAGHRRYEAFKFLNKKTIPAIVKENVSSKDLAILSLSENLIRENLHPIENAIAIKNILDNGIVESQNKLANYVGLSKGHISKLMNILKLPNKFIQKIKQDDYKDINILILLNKIDDELLLFNIYDKIKTMSRLEAVKYINNHVFKKEKKDFILEIKQTKTKITINIDIKNLSEDQVAILNQKISTLI